ncbi:MAG: permease [Alphaproteobacteria bacterium]|nr:permease [Alphaproteobacteria bacterium]MCD8526315.1 permease [Alphaproteobacteria bacterium]MCD8571525.1 permease [Alphaproteobacteria bacterium]
MGLIRDKKLGVAENRRYDLPLHKSGGTGFLILLVMLMTFLAMMALSSFFVLGAITDRWSSGLENKMTIEIPAEDENEKLLTAEKIEEMSRLVGTALKDNSIVQDYKVLTREDIQELIAPWLGEDFSDDNMPLPGLISVTLRADGASRLPALESELKELAPHLRIDRHESWLNDLLHLTSSLQFSAFLILLIISFTTITAVAGAIRSRMAEHRKEVELLHLMGAHDLYIMKQFQRHAVNLTLKGGVAGVIFSCLVLTLIFWMAGRESEASLLPGFNFSTVHIITFALLPLFVAAIGGLTARFTVLRALAKMP